MQSLHLNRYPCILPTRPRCRQLRCTAIATPTQSQTRTKPCHVRIGGEWKDLTAWVAAHPAGTHWIADYHGRDATEVFYAFHSSDARATLARLPPLRDQEAAAVLETTARPCSRVQKEFRALRQQLEDQGWFERSAVHEVVGVWLYSVVVFCCGYVYVYVFKRIPCSTCTRDASIMHTTNPAHTHHHHLSPLTPSGISALHMGPVPGNRPMDDPLWHPTRRIPRLYPPGIESTR